jgi:hypothetical protein
MFSLTKKRVIILAAILFFVVLVPVVVACSTAVPGNQAGNGAKATVSPSSSAVNAGYGPLVLPGKTGNVPLAKWSDKATWGGTLPGVRAVVEIPKGRSVLLDVNTPALKSLTISGTLICDERDVSITADWILIINGGRLQCGAQNAPFRHRFVVTLTASNPNENVMSMGTKLLGVMSGSLELHGEQRVSWTRLGATAPAGSTRIVLDKVVDWRVGDKIVIASTDYSPTQTEEFTIRAISGSTATLDKALKYSHWGQLQTFDGRVIDERAEVGLLTHNIVVQGDASSVASGFGGHTMIMRGGVAYIEGVEFLNMGQKAHLARYPLHWHMAGDVNGAYFKNNSIVHSFNRCLTIHATSRLLVQSNVAFDTIGHCYFFEDAVETGNVLENNLGLYTRKPASDKEALLSTDMRPSTYWITNPNNVLRGNVAAGSQSLGFWYAFPEHPTGFSRSATNDKQVWPRFTPLGVFSDNVAHSNDDTGLNVDGGMRLDGKSDATWYTPRTAPNEKATPIVANFQNFVAYKNRSLGAWLRGENLLLSGARMADNGGGAIFAARETFIQDSLIVGETGNKGTPEAWEKKGLDGRSVPYPWAPETPIMGYSFYDGRVGAQRVTFVNFVSNKLRPASGLSYLRSNSFPVDVRNFAQSLRFINANQVYLENPHADRDGDKAAVFLDLDGSVTGKAGQYVVVNNPLLNVAGCSFKTEWNTGICTGRYINFSVGSDDAAVAPLTIDRNDGVSASLVGIPGNPKHVSMTVLPGRSYSIKFPGAAPKKLRLYLHQVSGGDWIRVAIPVKGTLSMVYRDYNTYTPLKPASSLATLDSSAGDLYYYDSAAGMLYVKAVAQKNRDWTTVFADFK